jgi:hypothetical protein
MSVAMKNITVRVDEAILEAARERARSEGTTLNELFRRWLADYAGREARADLAMKTIRDLQSRIRLGDRRFTREEMNQR